MRRPAVPLLIALAAAALAVWRRSRRRAAALPAVPQTPAAPAAPAPRALARAPRLLEAPAPVAAAAEPTAAGDMDTAPARTPVAAAHPTVKPHPEVERETRLRFARSGPRFVSIAWWAVDDPPPEDATELPIRFQLAAGGAMRLDRIDVRETGSQVFVTVLAWWEPSPGDPRGSATEDHDATVTLAQPLGDRALVHAPHDHPSA